MESNKQRSSMKDYKIIKQVGKGSYGTVFKVRRKSDGLIYAIKTINLGKLWLGKMDRKNKESTLNEIRILCSVQNEYIVGYMDAFLEKNGTQLCIGSPLISTKINQELNW